MLSSIRAWFIIKSRFQLQINSHFMKENSQLQIRIHEILQRRGFYALPLHSLISIQRLLQMEEAREAKAIEANTIFGLIKWTEQHQEKLQNYFVDKKYSELSLEIKLYVSSIIRNIIDPHEPQNMLENTMRNHLGYPFNPYPYLNFPPFPPPPIPNNNIPYQSPYIPYPNPQMNYYPIFGAYPPNGSQVVRNPSSSIKTELQRIAAQSKLKTQIEQQMPLAPQAPVKEDYEEENDEKLQEKIKINKAKVSKQAQKAKEINQFKPNIAENEPPLKRSKRIRQKRQKFSDVYQFKRYLLQQSEIEESNKKSEKLQVPQKSQRKLQYQQSQQTFRSKSSIQQCQMAQRAEQARNNSRKTAPQIQIQHNPVVVNHPLVIPESIDEEDPEKQEKYPELQLKNYNSISDFDYKLFPPALSKNKKTSKTVETQTELNFILNDFQIINQKEQPPEQSQEDFLHNDEAKSNQPHNGQKEDVKLDQKPMFSEPAALASCLFQSILQENHVEHHAQEIQYVTPEHKVINNLYKCVCEGRQEGDWLECTSCYEKYHYWCLKIMQGAADNFECPRCRIRSIDPLVPVNDVCGQYFLSDLSEKPFKTSINFFNYEYLDITKNKNIDKMSEIELRCIKINYKETGQNEMCWPDEAVIKVNGLKSTQFYGSPGKRRKDGPIIITQSIFKYQDYDYEDIRNVTISLQLKNKNNAPQQYLLGVYFTVKSRVDELFQLIKSNLQPCSPDFMQNLMSICNQEEISLEKEVFRLNDPFSGQLMNLPVRGINCKHSQCFDLKTYLLLMYGLKHRAWRCPVCLRQAKKFVLDTSILELVQRIRQADASSAEVSLMNDGSIVVKATKASKQKESSSENQEEEERKKTKKIKKKERAPMVKRQDTDNQPIRTVLNPPKNIHNDHDSQKPRQKPPSDLDLNGFL